jgi:hypothetical protein
MSINVEKAMELFGKELYQYKCTKKLSGGVVLHIAPLGSSGYYVGTFTAYDKTGLKSEKAMPFNQYIRTVNEIEDLIEPYQINGFTGRLVGWNPSPVVKNFLYEKKVHRLFFLAETDVLAFMKNYTSQVRVDARADEGVEVIVMFG